MRFPDPGSSPPLCWKLNPASGADAPLGLGRPVVIALLAKAAHPDRAIGGQVDERVAAVLQAGALDHRDQRAVVDASDFFEVVLVAVPLKHGEYFSGCFTQL